MLDYLIRIAATCIAELEHQRAIRRRPRPVRKPAPNPGLTLTASCPHCPEPDACQRDGCAVRRGWQR